MDTNTCVSKFICSRREQNNYSTHVSMIKPLGNFNIERSDLEQFWKLYCDELQTNGNKFICGLAEKNNKDTKYIPVLNDTDIKLTLNDSNKNSKKLYTDNHIREVIKTYQKYLKNYIIDYKPIYGICFVLEKPNPTILIDKNKISHGFHLHFPYTFMSKVDQEILLLPNIKNELIDKKIFEDIGATTSECIDNATNKCWLMYGGRKEVNKQTYKLSKIYDDNLHEITLAEALKDYTLTNTFGEVINFVDSHEYYLPRILSIDCENKNVVQTKDNIEIVIKQQLKKATELKFKDLDIPITDTLKKAREFLKLIKSERADNYDDWLDIGITLYCIGNGCSEALDMWLDFSKKTSKINYYSEKYCVYTWNHFENRGKSIGSLANYAKQDDPEKYEKIKKESTERLTKEIINGGHYDLALLLKNKFGDDFKCYDDTKGHWFRYENHRWKYDQNGLRLKKKIPILLVKEFVEKRKKLLSEIGDSEEIDLNNHKGIKNINKIIANLKSMPFINCIMKACQMIFYDEEFVEKLDTDPYLLHFSNGILDLRTRKLRDGRPEDFISLTTGYDFKQYSYDDPDIIMVNEHLNKIFPDPELKQYFLEYCAMLLKGGNKSKTFLVLSGHGDNGKSINMELLKLVLGKYMRILPTTVLTGKKAQSSQATPELDGINGVRHVLVQEPEGKETMNIGTLKELTGNDEIYIRGLFKEGRNILPLFKLSMTCLTGDTLVSMSNGVSYRLENLQTNNFNVLSYDINKNGLINNTINNFYNQGIKQCVELTFSDGRKIKCTPDHKFLTVNNEWVEAQNINNNEIKFGIKYVDCSDVFTECSNYKFLDYNLNNLQDKLKASALCRIIGYIITDGTLNSMLYIGHKIDVDVIQEDIKLLYGKIVYFGRNKHVWQLSLPKNIKDMINKIIPIQYGGKVRNTMCLPEFIFDDDCPKFLIREVIAGMFGGDGCIPSVNKNAISRLQLVNSKNKENLNSLITQFSKLSILLKNKFDIESYVSEPQLYDIEQEHYHVYLNIGKLDSILKFINNIGIRYCCHKSYRLTCIHSLINLKNSIIDQNNKIIERTKILVDTFRRQNVLPHIEQYNKDNTYIATFKTTQIAEHSTGIRHGEIKGACKRNGTAGGYIWKFKTFESEKLNEPGVEHFRNALQVAINELKTKGEIINEKYLITYSQLTYYIRNNISYDMPVIFNKRIFLKETGLNNFCNNLTKKVHYSVDINSNVLPTFNLKLINIKNIGLQQVYDINVEHTHNFLANGAVVHNCNALPRLPFDDPATWNRIRVLFHESTFPKDASLVPAEENEQYIKKIFPRDDFFSEKLPKMKQPMMWLMFDILGKIEKNGRMKEPEKVKKATLMYRENNDVFYQFIKEKIVEDHTENCGITLIEAFTAFREWFKNSFPNVSIPDKNDMKKDLLLKWGEIDKKTRKWLNYRLREDKDDLRDGTLIILNEQDLQQDNKIPEFKPVEYEELKLVDNDNDTYIILEEDKPMTKFKKINRLNKYIIPENEIEFEIESDSDSDIDIDTSPLKIYTHKHPQQNKFECENTSDDETTLEITDESDSDTDSE